MVLTLALVIMVGLGSLTGWLNFLLVFWCLDVSLDTNFCNIGFIIAFVASHFNYNIH